MSWNECLYRYHLAHGGQFLAGEDDDGLLILPWKDRPASGFPPHDRPDLPSDGRLIVLPNFSFGNHNRPCSPQNNNRKDLL